MQPEIPVPYSQVCYCCLVWGKHNLSTEYQIIFLKTGGIILHNYTNRSSIEKSLMLIYLFINCMVHSVQQPTAASNKTALLYIKSTYVIFKIHEIMWNANLMLQGKFIDVFLALHVSGIYAHHQGIRCWVTAYGFLHRVFGWMLALRAAHSGSQDHHPSRNSVQKTIRCNSTSNAPDDGRMYLTHVELRVRQ